MSKKKRSFPIRMKKQDNKSKSVGADGSLDIAPKNSDINHWHADSAQNNVVIPLEDLAQLTKMASRLHRDARALDKRVQEIRRGTSSLELEGKDESLKHRRLINLLFLIAPFIGLLIGYAIYFFVLKGG